MPSYHLIVIQILRGVEALSTSLYNPSPLAACRLNNPLLEGAHLTQCKLNVQPSSYSNSDSPPPLPARL